MVTKSKMSLHDLSRQNFRRFSGMALLAAISLVLLAGCGGGGGGNGNSPGSTNTGTNSGGNNNGGGGTNSPYAGNYVGNLVELSANSSQDVGLSKMTVTAAGAVSGNFSGFTKNGGVTIPFTGTLSNSGALAIAYTSGGTPAHSTGTLTAGANHTLTGTLQETEDAGGTGPASYVTFGTAATAPAITGTHAITLTTSNGSLTVNGSVTIASDGTLTDTLTGNSGSTVSGLGYLDAGNNLFFTASAVPGATPIIFVANLQSSGSGFAVVGKDYSAGVPLNQATSFTGTLTGGGTGTNSPYAGTYQGAYLNTSGQYSPASGTLAFTVNSTGVVTATIFNSDGSTGNDTGTINSNGTFSVREAGGDGIDGTLSQNSTTHVFSMSYTEPNGTKGMLSVGLVPTSSPLAGSYSGTYSSAGVEQGTVTLTITSTGTITATTTRAGASNPLSGYVDSAGNIYLAYNSSGVPAISVGTLTLAGTMLSGTVQESKDDGSSSTITVSLTKH